jgi:hypothetical protein
MPGAPDVAAFRGNDAGRIVSMDFQKQGMLPAL